jgi:hypothetical protein
MSKKIYPVFFFVAVAVLAGYFFVRKSSIPTNSALPSPTANQIQTIKLIINTGDNNPLPFTLPATATSTPYSLLSQAVQSNNWEMSVIQYDFGVFVESLLGKSSSADTSWIYFVNGQSGSVASDKATLQPGDVVEWKYTKPN